jgi:hypothetical protein
MLCNLSSFTAYKSNYHYSNYCHAFECDHKLSTQVSLSAKDKIVEFHLHSPIRVHGVVLN